MGSPYSLEDFDSSKTIFYNKLNKKFECENNPKIICLGDFNASSSATWYNLSFRKNKIIENLIANDNGLWFHEFFNNHSLSILKTWFSHKKCHRITWCSPDQVTMNVFCFILACSWIHQYVSNCPVYNSYDFDSDYRLVTASICTPCNKVAKYVKRAAISAKSMLTWST